ncbi:ribosomal protein S25 [Inquilinus ginsengisoli]|uniref:hypothetical protein n=1 Tax=Inquilinus ginsengisoli TaxID=363840 RepID=UPI003D1CDC2E
MTVALRERLLNAALNEHSLLSVAMAAAQSAEEWICAGAPRATLPTAEPQRQADCLKRPSTSQSEDPERPVAGDPATSGGWKEATFYAIREMSQAGKPVTKTTLSSYMRIPLGNAADRLRRLRLAGEIERHGQYHGAHYRLVGDGPLTRSAFAEVDRGKETMAALHALVGRKEQATTLALARALGTSLDRARHRVTDLLLQGKVRNVGTSTKHVYWPVDIRFSEERAPVSAPEGWLDPEPETWAEDLMKVIAEFRSRKVRVNRRLIEQRMGISQGVAYKRLDKLLEQGRLKRSGGGNRVEYRLADEPADAWEEAALVEEEPPVAPGDPTVIWKAAHDLSRHGFEVTGGPYDFIVDEQPRDGRWIVETANRHRMRNDERPFLLGGPLVSPDREQGRHNGSAHS